MRRNMMNNFIFPVTLSPIIVIGIAFSALGYIMRPIIWILSPFRKIIAAAIAGASGVFGVYWTEIFPYNNDLIKISYEAYFYIKYIMTGLFFGVAFMISSDLYKD